MMTPTRHANHLGIGDEEEAVSRVTVMNSGILKRSLGLSTNAFPKRYAVQGNWTAWVLGVVGLSVVLSPKLFIPLLYGKEVWGMSIWNGLYVPFIGLYVCCVLFVMLAKIPYALEREDGGFVVHFLALRVRVELKDVEEVRVVRKWMMKDSAKMVAQAVPGSCKPCIGSSQISYQEVGAPKQTIKLCFPFSICEPFMCCGGSKLFWGAPGRSREVVIVSVRNSWCGNYVLDLADTDAFLRDNRADYSNILPKIGAPPPQIIGMAKEDVKFDAAASPVSTTCSTSPLRSIASPLGSSALSLSEAANSPSNSPTASPSSSTDSKILPVVSPSDSVGKGGMASAFEDPTESPASPTDSKILPVRLLQ